MSAGNKVQFSVNLGERNNNTIIVIGGENLSEARNNLFDFLGQEAAEAYLARGRAMFEWALTKELLEHEAGGQPVEGDRFAHRRETTAAPQQPQYAPPAQPAYAPPQQPAYQPPPPPQQPAAPAGPAPSCAHGQRVYRTGTSGKGPWQAWFCPLPKERRAEQCKAMFVNG